MNGLGLHLLKCPSGVYKWVGSIPLSLCTFTPATGLDIMAGRTITGADGKELVYKSSTYRTTDEALEDARNNGEKPCDLDGCGCRELFPN